MKKFFTIAIVFFSAGLFAQPPAGQARPGDVYGAAVTNEHVIEASALPAALQSNDTPYVKVMAKVLEVCSKKGCWLTFRVNDSTEAFVKMKDYGFFVPTALAGKVAVLDGKAFIKSTSVEELKHYAEDAKKPQKEIDAITKPKNEIRFIANGILVTGFQK
jgi:hypothetical protein